MELKVVTKQIIDESDFSKLVSDTYGRPYRLQQQEPLMNQDSYMPIQVPNDWHAADKDHARLRKWIEENPPQYVDGQEPTYPSFKEWLDRDANAYVGGRDMYEGWGDPGGFWYTLWWERAFFPPLGEVIDDLHKRGLLDEGEYLIHAWW